MRDITLYLDHGSEPRCPVCYDLIDVGSYEIATAHDSYFLAHTECIDQALADEGDPCREQ